ncbi:MAG: endonuclease/exonuclease/phosphatase family protein [Candidatus Cryptobacteroides sp.]
MKKLFGILLLLLLSVPGFGAVLKISADELRPSGLAATKGGVLVAALQADNSSILIKGNATADSWTQFMKLDGATDAVLWRGFAGELRLFYTHSGDICMRICPAPDSEPDVWTDAVVIAKGYCSSAPVALRNGAVLLPVFLSEKGSPGVLFSMDRADSWIALPAKADIPEKVRTQRPDPILLPYRNGKLLMLNRGTGYQWRWGSLSADFGRSWTPADKFIYSPDTPMSVSVLPGGKWLAVKNGRLDQELYYTPDRLIAYLSDDEGKSWYGDLIIDSRVDAVHPCVCAPGNGYIYLMYAYKPHNGQCSEVWCVRTSEMEINNAAATRNMEAANRFPVASATVDSYVKDIAPYMNTKGRPSGAPLTVATYNIEYRNPGEGAPWEERLKYVNELFRQHNFDVVGVQEPHRPEYDELCTALGDKWGGIFACTNLEKDDFSNSIFYRKERVELLDNGIFWYTEVPGKPRGFGGISSRLCIWAKFRDRTDGNVFFVFNSHFDFVSHEAMMTSARLLVSKVREIAGGYPALCTGDYNSPDANPAMRYLAEGPWLMDSMTRAKKSVNPKSDSRGRYRTRDNHPQNSNHIDHIFFTPGLSRVDSWEILSEPHCGLTAGSDHNPIKIQWQILK